MKWIIYCALAAVVALMSACDNSTFKISADIAGMGNQNIHVVFLGDSGVSDAFIPVTDGKFKIKGNSHDMTVVGILDSQNKPLFRIAVSGGETVEVTGDINSPHHYRCKGSDAAEQWMDFERENAKLYDMADRSQLDRAIEKYVKENPKNVVSTLLLVADYSNAEAALKLLDKVAVEARPESLVMSIDRMYAVQDKVSKQIHTMMLCSLNGEFEPLVPASSGATLIYWWTDYTPSRRDDIRAIKKLSEQYGERLMVADVSLMPDTMGWRPTIKADTTQWKHYWAPGSILDQAVEPLHLRSLPVCIIADSTGRQIYRGNDIKDITSTLGKYFK